jgi:hypothetical protein
MTIEWEPKETICGLYGNVGGQCVTELQESNKGVKLYFFEVVIGFYKNYHVAKAKAEQLFKEWNEAAGLISRSDIFSCPECGNTGSYLAGKTINPESMFSWKSTKKCACRKNPNSIWSLEQASINRAVREEGR